MLPAATPRSAIGWRKTKPEMSCVPVISTAILRVARREFADVNESLAKGNPDRHVDPKTPDRGAAGLRLTTENGTVPRKMPLSILAARIEEPDDFACLRIDARKICTLVQIAWHASQGSIIRTIRAAMRLGDDVIELER